MTLIREHDDQQDDPDGGRIAELALREGRLVDEELERRRAVAGPALRHHEDEAEQCREAP